MSKLNSDDKRLINLILDNLKDRRIDFKKKKSIIRTYDKINKILLDNEYSAFDINNLISDNKNLQISKFLKNLAIEYNNILYKNLLKYNFKNDNNIKDFCSRCKIRGYKKIKDNILEIATSKNNKWEGYWSFSEYNKGKINNIKLIDPDIIKKLI
jgi:hypothetical protein